MVYFYLEYQEALYWHVLTEFWAWINNYTHCFMCDMILILILVLTTTVI